MNVIKAGLALVLLLGCAHARPSFKDTSKLFMEYTMSSFGKVPWHEPILREINNKILNHENVQISIVIDSDFDQNQEKLLGTIISAVYLRCYGSFSNFSMVERTELDKILKERKLTYTGLIEGGPSDVANILPVTHVLYIFVHYGTEAGKLLDVRTGRICAAYAHPLG